MTTTTTTTRLADLLTAHYALRERYHAIGEEIAGLMEANAKGEVAEDAAWYASIDALDAERSEVADAEEAMRPEIHAAGAAVAADADAEVVRVRGINVGAFERGLDMSADAWTCEKYPENTCRTGKSWIEGPRGLIAEMVGACEELCDENIVATAGWDWSESTPRWMVEQTYARMIAAAKRACRKIDAQL
jgi:hypothetical protein